MSYVTVTSSGELESLCEESRSQGRLGLDTEFLWERTYAPHLCLAQLAVGDTVAIADPLAGIDLTPIARLLDDPAVQIVMHAPHADLVAFALHYAVAPSNVFDTQIAAGFVGLSAGLAYERLIHDTLGVQVKASESFSDWTKRPLGAKQLAYAAEDVEYLFAAADEIIARLDRLGRTNWARNEMQRRFERPERLATQPALAWRKVARRGKLKGHELGVLQAVAAWREQAARARDLPSGWILKDASLVEIARRKPSDSRSLTRIRGVDASLRRHEADELVAAVRAGGDTTVEVEEAHTSRAVKRRITAAKGLATSLMRARCDDADIAPELVGTSSDLEELIAFVAEGGDTSGAGSDDEQLPLLLRAWRAELVGSELVDLLDGRILLQLTDSPPYMAIHDRR